jgi:anti-sigma regulatory factor (Ser/Thr protein kinase)
VSRFHEAAPAVPASVGHLRRGVAEFARSQGADEGVVMALQLAASEALSNAVVHAFIDRPAPGTLTVSAVRDGDAICVIVRDDGCGMRPRDDSPGLGIGMPLMTGSTQALTFSEIPEGGTEVTMRFALAT